MSVDKVAHMGGPAAPPERIDVQDFELSGGVARVDRGGEALEKFEKQFVRELTLATVERVRKRLAPSSALGQDAAITQTRSWLVTGRFVRINQGSRALRAAVGFGLGGTKIETRVTVCDLSGPQARPFLTFVTTGGSNSQPGAAVGFILPNYWLMALDAIGKGLPGLHADAIRTSREIVSVLSEYMAQEGFLPPRKISRSKKLGKWP